ncbi:unnamed protein product [Thelazia callipaeda]|uniref:FERM domain-containing protein n=1 Tax=Thelazia callipaeda TaxID=103827 RepID=A0A0N5CXT6_THECL|nr:unnamed protein product [Thelazia callipaeda]
MPTNDSAIMSSLFGRISARASLLSTRDYKTTIQLLDDNDTIFQEFKKSSNAQVVLDYVCEFLNIIEKDYFGLRYQDLSKHRIINSNIFQYWMDLNKPICKQVRGPIATLRFRVRFYPSDIGVLKEEITRYMLFAQLQRDLLHGRLYCPQNEAAVLGALALQSVIGDYDAEDRPKDYVSKYKLLLKQTEKHEEKIAEAHKQFKGLTPAEAEMEFLKRASKLDTYGFDPFTVTNKQKQVMYIGVTHRGIFIYHVSRMVDYIGKEIIITPVQSYVSPYSSSPEDVEGLTKQQKKKNALKFQCPSAMFAKHLWRHILSQQAFFTEKDAKHIKPKFSKPRIPLLTRGSTFHFPTLRVLHEIEAGGGNKREGPQPRFTRYPLQHQAPRLQSYTTDIKYNSLPNARVINRVVEDKESVIAENLEEEKNVEDSIALDKVNQISIFAPQFQTTFTIRLVRKEPLSPHSYECCSECTMESTDKDCFDKMLDAVRPLRASANEGGNSKHDTILIGTSTSSPITIATTTSTTKTMNTDGFRHGDQRDSPWSNSVPALDTVRHVLYEPIRHHILALYVRFINH